jgi:opacity protein-like surface antigen
MKQKKFLLVIFSMLCFLVIGPAQALAEGFIDIYGGWASTRDADVDVSISSSGLGFVSTESDTEKVDFGSSYTLGARVGYWFEKLPYVGIAGDLSYFRAEDKTTEIHVVPISLLLMLRYPLFKSEKFPNGRIQPYAGIGPGFFLSVSDVDFRPTLPKTLSGTSFDVGLDLRAGIAWQFHKHLALFGEYRYTDFSIDLEQTDILYGLAGTKETMKTQLSTNHFLIGISYRF